MTIADRIRLTRERLNLSQDELAKRCGYADKTSISKIENAGDDITLKKIKRIATALGVSHSYLMGWESESNDSDILVDESNLSANDIELATRLYDLYLQAPPEIQAAVETMLKSQLRDS